MKKLVALPCSAGFLVLPESSFSKFLYDDPQFSIRAVELALMLHASKRLDQPPKVYLHREGWVPGKSSALDRIIVLPVYPPGLYSPGVKLIGSHPGNVSQGMERANAQIVLFNPQTNAPSAIVEGNLISSMRTFAMTPISMALFSPTPRTVGIIGMGKLGVMHVSFLSQLYPSIEQFLCFSNTAPVYEGGKVKKAGSVEEVLRDSDVIVLTTSASAPYIHSADFPSDGKPRLVVNLSIRDLAQDVFRDATKLVVDDIEQCRHLKLTPLGQFLSVPERAARATEISSEWVRRDTFGKGKTAPGLTIVTPVGMAIQDVVLAQAILDLRFSKSKL